MTSRAPAPANEALAKRAAEIVTSHPPRTPQRRAAAAAWSALITTATVNAARKALDFADPDTRAAATVLLRQLEAGTA